MATPAYIPIYTTTLASAASSVLMAGIPQDYVDLIIVFDGGVTARTGQYLEFNGDTTNANYSNVYAVGSGSTATSGSASNRIFAEVIENNSSNNAIIQIMDYSATDKHKTSLIRVNNATNNGTEMRVYRWANTSAITSINLVAAGTTWLAGSSFALYGILGTE